MRPPPTLRLLLGPLGAAALSSACVFGVEPPARHAADDARDADEDPDPNEPDPNAPDPNDPDPNDPDPNDGPLPLDGPACDAHRDRLEGFLATLDAERAGMQIPGAALAVVIDDCLFARGLGVEVDGGAAVDEHTRFQLASLTKTLTALTALSLEEDGIVDRSAPAAALAPTTTDASLDDLLAHRAGFPTDLTDSASLELSTFISENADAPMWAPPGEVWLYSNPGYALAGRVLEIAAGAPFAQLVRERVFEPAGMTDALMGAELTGDETAMALGHAGSAASPELIAPTDLYLASTYYGPMGGAFASAADLARLMRAFMTEDMLSSASLDDMSAPRGAAYGGGIGYGQGLFTYHDGTVFHGGSVAGFLCEMDVHRGARVGVAVLSAADWDFPYAALYEALGALLPPPPAPPDDDAPTPAEIVGTYTDDVVLGSIAVSGTGGALSITLEGATHAMTSWGGGSYGFYYPPWQTEIEASFQRGPSGALYLVTLLGVGVKDEDA